MGLKDLLEAVNLEDELIEETTKSKEKTGPKKEKKDAEPKNKDKGNKVKNKEEEAPVKEASKEPEKEVSQPIADTQPVEVAEETPAQNIHVQNIHVQSVPQMPAIPEIEPRKGTGRPKVYGKRQGINLQLNEENYIKARQWSGFYGSMTAYINALIANDTRPFPQQSSPYNDN
nr:hypothetical protein [uncultured Butyrivibrio sp.]